MNHSRLTPAVLLIALPGCLWNKFPDALSGGDASIQRHSKAIQAPGGQACIHAVFHQTSDEEERILTQALAEVCKVVFSEELVRLLQPETLEVHNFRPPAHLVSVSGQKTSDLIDRLRAILPSRPVQFFVEWRMQNETAATVAWPNRLVSLQPERLAQWERKSLIERAELVDTLAHELTHLAVCPELSQGDVECEANEQEVTDDDRNADERTFSYRFGQVAAALYVKREVDRGLPGARVVQETQTTAHGSLLMKENSED